MSLLDTFKSIFGKKDNVPREEIMRAFKKRYISFKDLLQSNTDLATTMAGLESILKNKSDININDIRTEVTKAVFHTMRMAISLNAIGSGRYKALIDQVEQIDKNIRNELEQRLLDEIADFTLPLTEISAEQAFYVGSKSANLGQIRKIDNIVIPRGFAITTTAYHTFMRSNNLLEDVRKLMRDCEKDNQDSIANVSAEITKLIESTPLPEEVERDLFSAWDNTFGADQNIIVALRSSAVSEDGSSSFAGQYLTELGVRRENLLIAWRKVAASLFSARAITYRLRQGFVFEQCAMGVCCLEMVNALAAGVAFSRHPVDPSSENIVVNGLWGLGELVVDGAAEPDSWLIARSSLQIVDEHIVDKQKHMFMDESGQTKIDFVPEAMRKMPCLNEDKVKKLGEIALILEKHYHRPQDLEWAVSTTGQLILLQSRPMLLADGRKEITPIEKPIENAKLLLDNGEVASSGIGYGPVFFAEPNDDLAAFPPGGILVARHSSPNFVVIMDKAAAIVADRGSITGHMASVCREFEVPAILNIKDASTKLQNDQYITVDAISGRVYDGKVDELLNLHKQREINLDDTPVHALLRRVASHILPLHLIDPKSALFNSENCTSLHDVMRFAHELSYAEIFKLSDSAAEAGSVARAMRCKVPLDLHVIDLGGGVEDIENKKVLYPDDVCCAPFKSLLDGMLAPEVHSTGPRPINMQGFMHVMGQNMIGGHGQGERFGDRSYAIISDRYINFSSRVGYHYAILDAWCGDTINKNYISFKFAGGAADEIRRERRVHCIGLILKRLGFTIDILRDRIQARYQKYSKDEIAERLDQIGRLLIMTRQMDMLMVSEQSIITFADNFMERKYH